MWDRGHRVAHAPAAILTYDEPKTRGRVQGGEGGLSSSVASRRRS
jgi:hypothetical protein